MCGFSESLASTLPSWHRPSDDPRPLQKNPCLVKQDGFAHEFCYSEPGFKAFSDAIDFSRVYGVYPGKMATMRASTHRTVGEAE